MGMHLVVANDLETLADRLVDRLSGVPDDPFLPETIVVPGDGVRSWLTHAIALRLGICSNIQFSYPARFLKDTFSLESKMGTWETGPLTWAVHAIQKEGGVDDLMRARAIADVFDRYILYRPHMVRRWSDGEDVDGSLQTLADHHLWQPELWRQLEARLGRSDARAYEQLTNASADEISFTGSIPPRVSIFGLTTMPQPQLDLFRVLSTKTEVAVFAPVSSSSRWESVRSAWREELRFPALRDAHPRPTGGFRLNTVWGRTNEEGHTLLLDSVLATSGEVEGPVNIKRDSAGGDDITLLSSLQDAIDHDTIPDAEVPLDRTVVIHRTFGATRQVEVLRDHLLHLFNERHRDGSAVFAPRDVVVLTNDVERFAPLVQSVFAGNPAAGVPDIPVQIADRSLGVTNPIATVGQQLLQLLDGRFRVDDVVELLAQPVVAMSFDIEPADVPRVSELLTMANARWGLDGDDQRAVGIEPLGTFTLLDALNRLVSAVATAASGPELVGDRIAPLREVSFDDVALLGKTALFLQQLHDSCSQLNLFAPPRDWFITFREALGHLVFVSDDEVLWWRALDRLCEQLCDEVELAGDYSASVAANPADLAVLVNSRLASTAGMPRFQTGRVTLSSLTAVRGVPHSVVCLLGVDREGEPNTLGNPDDLTQSPQCIGDRDQRSEYQAQLLDAVMSAQDRLILCSTGFDVTSGAEVSPSPALSELIDALGDLIGRKFPLVHHPRQTWSEANFVIHPEVSDRPWSHDRSAVEAAISRRSQHKQQPESLVLTERPDGPCTIADLRHAFGQPIRTFCEDRLHLAALQEFGRERGSNIPLGLDGLDRYGLRNGMLSSAMGGGDPEDWVDFLTASGDVPPGVYGTASLQTARDDAKAIVDALSSEGMTLPLVTTSLDVHLTSEDGDVELTGVIDSLHGSTVLDIAASSSFANHFCERLVDLVVLSVASPQTQWRLSMYRVSNTKARVRHLTVSLTPSADPRELLDGLINLRREVLIRPVPLFAGVALAQCCGGDPKAEWEGNQVRPGEREQTFNRLLFDFGYEELLDQTTILRDVDKWFASLLRSVEINDSTGKLQSMNEVAS